MSVGNKVKRITIQAATLTADGHGGSTTSWTGAPRCVVNAHERPLSGTEALRAAQVTAVLSSVWEIWFRDDISIKDRVRYQGRTCEVESYYDPKDDRKELYLVTSEIQA
jgi:SPP1 family predicted phage head-tail adaptor